MTDTFQLPLLRSNDHKRNSEKKNLIYTDEVKVSNIDHTKIINKILDFSIKMQKTDNVESLLLGYTIAKLTFFS